MKIYEFPYSGSGGKGDSWENTISIELTDSEAERLEQSAKKESRWKLHNDQEIHDIYEKVANAAYDQEIKNLKSLDDMFDEWRNEYSNEDDTDEVPIEEILRRYLEDQLISIYYPLDLQYL